jgi:hypothetical protein
VSGESIPRLRPQGRHPLWPGSLRCARPLGASPGWAPALLGIAPEAQAFLRVPAAAAVPWGARRAKRVSRCASASACAELSLARSSLRFHPPARGWASPRSRFVMRTVAGSPRRCGLVLRLRHTYARLAPLRINDLRVTADVRKQPAADHPICGSVGGYSPRRPGLRLAGRDAASRRPPRLTAGVGLRRDRQAAGTLPR